MAEAKLFAKEGAPIVVADSMDDTGKATVDKIRADGAEAVYVPATSPGGRC